MGPNLALHYLGFMTYTHGVAEGPRFLDAAQDTSIVAI